MSKKLNQERIPRIPMQIENLYELIAQGNPNWKLVRERDGLTKHSVDVIWLEFNEEGRFKSKHSEPAVGRTLLMSPFSEFFTWQTTPVTEIVEHRDGYVKFHTSNSTYELFKLTNNEQDTNP